MLWNPVNIFNYSVKQVESVRNVIKSQVLFDSLSLIWSAILSEKVLMEKLWSLKLGCDKLNELKALIISYNIFSPTPYNIQFHWLCNVSDVDEVCIYIKCESANSNIMVWLACELVCPNKKVSLPRLKLCY